MQHCTIREINNEQRMNEAIMMTKKEQKNIGPPVGHFSRLAGKREKKKVHHSYTLAEHDMTDIWLTSKPLCNTKINYFSAFRIPVLPCICLILFLCFLCMLKRTHRVLAMRTLPLYPWAILGSSYWSLNNPLSFSQWDSQSGKQNSNHSERCWKRSIILTGKWKCVSVCACVCLFSCAPSAAAPPSTVIFTVGCWCYGGQEEKNKEEKSIR